MPPSSPVQQGSIVAIGVLLRRSPNRTAK